MACVLRALIALLVVSATPRYCEASIAARHVARNAVFTSGILKVERFGNRASRAIVFIPALFCGSWQWNAQINALSARYDVVVVTLPGFDGRPATAGDTLMQRAAASLHQLILTHRLRRPVIVGHSLGGTLAVYFAEHYPHDATNVVTVEGGYPLAPTQAQRDALVAKSAAPYAGIAKSAVGPTVRERTLQYTITSKADVDAVEALAARSDPGAIVAWMRAALLLDLTPGLSKITVPFTAIIPFDPEIDPYQGFKTRAAKQAAYANWVVHALDGEVILIDHSRHFVMFDRPREFEVALEAAIARPELGSPLQSGGGNQKLMRLADPHDVACNVTPEVPLNGRFGSYDGVEERRCFERSSTREPSLTPGVIEASFGRVEGAPKRLFAKQPF